MQLQSIKLANIQVNDYNPNEVPEDKLRLLKTSISRDGYLQPIIVRKHETEDGKFVIIDGEHRFKALQELQYGEVPCLIVDVDRLDAMLQTLNMNNLRGEFESIKLAEVVLSLREQWDDAKISEMLGYSDVDLSTFEDLADYDFDKANQSVIDRKNAKTLTDSLKDTPGMMTFLFTPDEEDIVMRAIQKKNLGSNAQSLVDICRQHLLKNHPDQYNEVEQRFQERKANETQEISVETDETIAEPSM